ncbi:hypothetical protein [Seohaeicola zhoushanensis]|uniref:Uncharacterized protein n=1 Tax=Seohaeicola zhoushanensis TaxID=1569283 RepID=A0A8J3M4Z1_9RHOB|nr:hypothetical protein [Seohaeicola zhoushanensis]GHF41190.1 hypothetical protein GCM10017056_11000 [Seohaeicola zhoushanensis]
MPDFESLSEAVAAGCPGTHEQHLAAFGHSEYQRKFSEIIDRDNLQAVDDAEALFNELLPGWNWGRAFKGVFWASRGRVEHRASHEIPAYAFLLLILKAVKARHA